MDEDVTGCEIDLRVASATGAAAGGDGRGDRDAARSDGSGEG